MTLAEYWHAGNNKPQTRRRLWAFVRIYALEWALTIVLWGCFYALDRVDGFRREFDINDSSLHHPYAEHSRVPASALFLISLLAPALIIFLIEVGWERSFWGWNVGWLGLALSLAVVSTITNIVKITVGRPRPDLLDRCQPFAGSANPLWGLSNSSICTRTDLLKDGFRSFPSGHSSISWCGMWYLTLYGAGKMGVYDRRGFSLKTWVLLVPVMAAALVAISRLMDYRHHPFDVLFGSALGILIGHYSYRLYYPSLSSAGAGKPYSPRVPRDDEELTQAIGRREDGGGVDLLAGRSSLGSAAQDHRPPVAEGQAV